MSRYECQILVIRIIAILLATIVFPFLYVFAMVGEFFEYLKTVILGFSIFRDLYNMWCRVLVDLFFKKADSEKKDEQHEHKEVKRGHGSCDSCGLNGGENCTSFTLCYEGELWEDKETI